MEGHDKDVVGARINLDTGKMLPAFKEIDAGAKKNSESFTGLIAKIVEAEKEYDRLSKSMSKTALSKEEQRKKILDESASLVAQRKASAELMNAKKQQLDTKNQLVDSKLQTQLAIQKKREQAIEQQEAEHQQRLVVLQNKVATASASENLLQAKIDRQFQIMKNGDMKLEMEAERHIAKLQEQAAKTASIDAKAQQQAEKHLASMLKQSGSTNYNVLDYSSQYLLSGTMYYAAITGAKEAIVTIKDFERTLVDLKRVMGDTADISLVKDYMIRDAKEYGYALKEVGDVYTQVAQQGFNERDTAEISKVALMAANVEESFQGAAQSQQLLTGALLNYNIAASDSERLLDRLNEVSNNYATDSNKLLQGINRVGASAKNAGVDINQLIGYLTVLNQAGFSGSVAGNAVKSFISFSTRDIAVDKLEKYVGTIKQANGEMLPFSELLDRISEKWNVLNDVQRNEITQAVARGDQASRFIALMNNYDKVLQVATTAENSFGSAQRENALTMTTLEKKSQQLKATWDELVISIGDSGLLSVLKEIVQQATLLIDGFNALPEPIRNTITTTLLLGTAIMTVNTGMKLLTGQSIVSMVAGLANGVRAMIGLKTATDAANLSQKAFIATPMGATLTLLSVGLTGAITAWSYFGGKQKAASEATRQNERDAFALVEKYNELKGAVDSNAQSDQEMKKAKEDLASVIERISKLMPGLISQWDQNGKAVDINAEKVRNFSKDYKESLRVMEEADKRSAEKERETLQKELNYLLEKSQGKGSLFDFEGFYKSMKGLVLNDPYMNFDPKDNADEFAAKIVKVSDKIAILDQKISSNKSSIEGLSDATGISAASLDDMGDGLDDADDAASDLESSLDDLQTQIKNNGTAISELNQLSADLSKGQSLNASNAMDLINKYPILADKIYKTADGWAFEKNAVEQLRKEKIQKAIDDLKSEQSSLQSTKLATTERLKAYGIEMDGIRDLAAYKAKMNEALDRKKSLESFADSPSSPFIGNGFDPNQYLKDQAAKMAAEEGANLQEIKSVYDDYFGTMDDYQKKIDKLTDLYNDPNYGVTKGSGSGSSKTDDPRNKAFQASQDYIDHKKKMGELTLEQELTAWQRVQSQYTKGTEWRKKADEQVASLQKQLIEERKQAEAEAYQQSMNWLAHKKATSEVSANDELAILEKLQARYKAGSEERMKLDELVYAAKKAKMQESFSLSEGWISHQKAMGQLSLQEELAAWERVQQRYLAGTEQRKQADEQVYALKQQLIEKEKDAMSKLASTQSSSLEKLKNDAIKRINDERDAFVTAQDAKIKAIDDLIAKEQESNEDDDYDAELAKKMARLTVLEAGVGIDAERERKQLIEEIDKMKLDRERTLRKRDLEAQKTQLQDEKELKEAGYKDQVSQLESHYDDLLDAFKSFSDDTVSQADALKQLQILKESEKNEIILSNLDTFIASYQSKMASINQLSGSSKESDLAEYNNNKDLWEKAKSSGNTAEMARLSERNQQIRDQYGIKSDTGKLQAFKDGGVVKGKPGAAVPVIAHAGEMYLNQGQQSNLFKLLDFAMPKISVPAYNFSSPQNTIINNYQFDNSIGSVSLEGTNAVAGLYDQRGGLIERQRTIGERVR
jgi:phage tail tape measure protein, TP901 family, core region